MNANKFRSNIQSLKDRVYDVLIIGGGITGANILWDSTLRGLKGLLVEKSDYASGTSQATSKLIHGGLRYLKNFELGLVRESLRERRILAKISPHAVETLGFFIPIYDMKTKFMLGAGMLMYDKLSYDKNKDISTDRLIPKYRSYSREEAIYEAPEISRARLRGAYLYYDYTNINPERHTTEFIFSAREQGAVARNYTQVIKIARLETGNFLVDLKDVLSGELISVESRTLVNSAGPWADYIEDMAGIKMDAKLVRSKGIHIVTRKISGNKCIVLQKRDGSHLFVIPWRNKTLIGTTDTSFNEEPDAMRVTKKEILDLIDEVNYSFG
ncbi:MAG: glycerol-3-phosphate dehydrogenase/oxidase, partial [Leptospiraceae bacterium]|nr:glycerol-3-phosphate dehydrogenase/oxidase [Leptospiraceae bacterium]